MDNENGVPLEHLITCAQDILIHYDKEKTYKYLKWEHEKSKREQQATRSPDQRAETAAANMSPPSDFMFESIDIDDVDADAIEMGGVGDSSRRKLGQFAHLVIDMLKSVSKCILPITKFNCEFYRKYGRQCRVADYGYSRLVDLLEAIPHVIQIIDGEFEKKITLTHRVQVIYHKNIP